MMIDQNAEAACIPFQRLVFAIRDWELDDDLGLEAGTKFLQSVMEEMEDTEEGVELLNSLRTSFSQGSTHQIRTFLEPGGARTKRYVDPCHQ